MPQLSIRWSEQEARKPYARPFGVRFLDDSGADCGSLAVSGQDLLYLRQFQAAVLSLGGELFLADRGADAQRDWLDRIAGLLPSVGSFRLRPHSSFDATAGRVFSFSVLEDAALRAELSAAALLEYQEFQAALAHQSGRLFRDAAVEAVDDAQARQEAWLGVLQERLQRPAEEDAMSERWPWR